MSLKELLKSVPGLEKALSLKKDPYSNGFSYDDLINAESELGSTLFGPIPVGHNRQFFKHKGNVWIWHEDYTDSFGILQDMTIRYEVRPTGVFKKIAGESYVKIEGEELNNFRQAAKNYLELVKSKLYC